MKQKAEIRVSSLYCLDICLPIFIQIAYQSDKIRTIIAFMLLVVLISLMVDMLTDLFQVFPKLNIFHWQADNYLRFYFFQRSEKKKTINIEYILVYSIKIIKIVNILYSIFLSMESYKFSFRINSSNWANDDDK